jgi:hypothetical protein
MLLSSVKGALNNMAILFKRVIDSPFFTERRELTNFLFWKSITLHRFLTTSGI